MRKRLEKTQADACHQMVALPQLGQTIIICRAANPTTATGAEQLESDFTVATTVKKAVDDMNIIGGLVVLLKNIHDMVVVISCG